MAMSRELVSDEAREALQDALHNWDLQSGKSAVDRFTDGLRVRNAAWAVLNELGAGQCCGNALDAAVAERDRLRRDLDGMVQLCEESRAEWVAERTRLHNEQARMGATALERGRELDANAARLMAYERQIAAAVPSPGVQTYIAELEATIEFMTGKPFTLDSLHVSEAGHDDLPAHDKGAGR